MKQIAHSVRPCFRKYLKSSKDKSQISQHKRLPKVAQLAHFRPIWQPCAAIATKAAADGGDAQMNIKSKTLAK